jgi:hypothetical protein
MAGSSTIGVIANREGWDPASLLSTVAADWRGAGCNVVGVLAEDNDDAEATCSAGFLRDIASGRKYQVSLDTMPAGTICHLDAAGMADACAGLLDQIAAADVVILSKFGKLEASGQGLWPAFAAAAGAGKPLLTTVSSRHVAAMKAFAATAVWLEADYVSVERWWEMTKTGNFSAPAS